MTRIIAGSARGRRVTVPAGGATRPTSDRAREGLFSTLTSLTDVEGAHFLDLYAGSGAIGLEALSRGAAAATLVERDPAALAAIRANVEKLGLPATVVDADVARFLSQGPSAYDVVVLDPPYETDVEPLLQALAPWLSPEAVVAVERRTGDAPPAPPAWLVAERSRRYGEATLWYFSRS